MALSSPSSSRIDTSSILSSSSAAASRSKPPTFAVPALPSKRPRPLSMSTLHNRVNSPLSPTTESDAVGGTKPGLKRLSLVSRPTKHDPDTPLATPGTPGTPGTPSGRRRAVGMRSSISYSPAIASTRGHGRVTQEEGGFERWKMERGMSEDVPMSGPSRPAAERRRSTALILERPGSIVEDNLADEFEAPPREEGGGKHRRGETLVEKHADLLTLIAQKERRVNDLRQELVAQEASLAQLKSRWASIVSRSAPTASPRINSTRSSRGHPLSGGSKSGRPTPIESTLQALTASAVTPSSTNDGDAMSTSTSSSSHLSALPTPDDLLDPTLTFDGELALTPRDSQSLAAFLQTLSLSTTPESLLGQETIEGGKRFWSQLVKTVSAAAGGTVPGPEGESPAEGSLSPRLDMSALKSILPSWTSAPAQPAPPRPANASRLPKKRRKSRSSLKPSPPRSATQPAGPADDGTGAITPSSSVGSSTSRASLSSGGIDLLSDDVASEQRMGDLQTPSLKPSKSSERSLKSTQETQAKDEEDDYDWGW